MSTHNLCFGPKKNKYAPANPIFLYKNGVQGGTLFMDMFSMELHRLTSYFNHFLCRLRKQNNHARAVTDILYVQYQRSNRKYPLLCFEEILKT